MKGDNFDNIRSVPQLSSSKPPSYLCLPSSSLSWSASLCWVSARSTSLYCSLSGRILYKPDPPENCHLNVKKLPKTFFFKCHWQFFWKKMSSFWQYLTFKWQFSGGSGESPEVRCCCYPPISACLEQVCVKRGTEHTECDTPSQTWPTYTAIFRSLHALTTSD